MTKNCPKPGIAVEVVHLVLTLAKVRWQWVLLNETDWGSRTADGTWSGTLKQLYNEDVDLLGFDMMPTAERLRSFQASFPWVEGKVTLLVPFMQSDLLRIASS